MTAGGIAISMYLPSQAAPGLGEDALRIAESVGRSLWAPDDPAVHDTSRRETAAAIERVYLECSDDNWDGHGASGVDWRSRQHALRFVQLLPPGTMAAEASVEPDGEIALEWHLSPDRFLIVSMSRNRELTYTWRIGHERAWGVRQFEDEIPGEVLECLGRILR